MRLANKESESRSNIEIHTTRISTAVVLCECISRVLCFICRLCRQRPRHCRISHILSVVAVHQFPSEQADPLCWYVHMLLHVVHTRSSMIAMLFQNGPRQLFPKLRDSEERRGWELWKERFNWILQQSVARKSVNHRVGVVRKGHALPASLTLETPGLDTIILQQFSVKGLAEQGGGSSLGATTQGKAMARTPRARMRIPSSPER